MCAGAVAAAAAAAAAPFKRVRWLSDVGVGDEVDVACLTTTEAAEDQPVARVRVTCVQTHISSLNKHH